MGPCTCPATAINVCTIGICKYIAIAIHVWALINLHIHSKCFKSMVSRTSTCTAILYRIYNDMLHVCNKLRAFSCSIQTISSIFLNSITNRCVQPKQRPGGPNSLFQIMFSDLSCSCPLSYELAENVPVPMFTRYTMLKHKCTTVGCQTLQIQYVHS